MAADLDPLFALSWLVDAGADEAVLDEPVNRLKAPSHPPLEGGSKNPSAARDFSGRGRATATPSELAPKFATQISTRPQGAGENSSDSIGNGMEIAARCNSLAELK